MVHTCFTRHEKAKASEVIGRNNERILSVEGKRKYPPPIYTKEITADAPKRVLVKGDSITVDLGDHYVG